ncbi:MAG TPA: hypothetical protein VFD32_05345 [Dehalococcoidia bacterium]|nr:hypothetical protein [Dehalococcoidia bacterium]
MAQSHASSSSENGAREDQNMIEEQKAKAAGALRDVASMMRERATNAPVPGADRAVAAAARPLESGANYIEQHSPGDMWSDLMQYCKSHPAGALAIGFGVGYLFHKLFR